MATGTSERVPGSVPRRAAWLAAAVLCAGLAAAAIATLAGGTAAGAYSWLTPRRAPAGWALLRTGSGATAPFPPGWQRIESDPGAASAAIKSRQGAILGYLNITPATKAESIADWARFRPAHVADEGARDLRVLNFGTALRLGSGTASCVTDSYRTTRFPYREMACIAQGPRATTVIVAAARADWWGRLHPTLEQAVRALTT